jgi:hypothetical protein
MCSSPLGQEPLPGRESADRARGHIRNRRRRTWDTDRGITVPTRACRWSAQLTDGGRARSRPPDRRRSPSRTSAYFPAGPRDQIAPADNPARCRSALAKREFMGLRAASVPPSPGRGCTRRARRVLGCRSLRRACSRGLGRQRRDRRGLRRLPRRAMAAGLGAPVAGGAYRRRARVAADGHNGVEFAGTRPERLRRFIDFVGRGASTRGWARRWVDPATSCA